jgi:hypothetical protein
VLLAGAPADDETKADVLAVVAECMAGSGGGGVVAAADGDDNGSGTDPGAGPH